MNSWFWSLAGGAAAASVVVMRRWFPEHAPATRQGTWRGEFRDRHPLNVPGPYYAAATDTCCCGPAEAPDNVLHDDDGLEFVWRQPRDDAECRAVVRAAETDPCLGYGQDGDDHWTPQLIAAWWHTLPDRQEDISRVLSSPLVMGNAENDRLVVRARTEWTRYWSSPELLHDLRRYAFRQQHGRWPAAHEALPTFTEPRR